MKGLSCADSWRKPKTKVNDGESCAKTAISELSVREPSYPSTTTSTKPHPILQPEVVSPPAWQSEIWCQTAFAVSFHSVALSHPTHPLPAAKSKKRKKQRIPATVQSVTLTVSGACVVPALPLLQYPLRSLR